MTKDNPGPEWYMVSIFWAKYKKNKQFITSWIHQIIFFLIATPLFSRNYWQAPSLYHDGNKKSSLFLTIQIPIKIPLTMTQSEYHG